MSEYSGEDRRSDGYGERLARIEESIKGLCRSVDELRHNFDKHTEEEVRLEQSVAEIQREIAMVKGGYAMFWKACGAIGIAVAAVWTVATVVFK